MNLMRSMREKSGLTLEQVSEKLKVPIDVLDEWEDGNLSPELSYAVKLSTLYKCTVDQLAGLTNDTTPVNQLKKAV